MKKLIATIQKDSKANKGNWETMLFLAVFRISSYLKVGIKKPPVGLLLAPLYLLFRIFYKVLSTLYLMEIPVGTNIGDGFIIYHLKGIVLNPEIKIGKNVTVNHFVTIADNVEIGDGVIINPLSVIVKGKIGDGAVIGAGSVVTKDVPDKTIVAGSPAKPIGNNVTDKTHPPDF